MGYRHPFANNELRDREPDVQCERDHQRRFDAARPVLGRGIGL